MMAGVGSGAGSSHEVKIARHAAMINRIFFMVSGDFWVNSQVQSIITVIVQMIKECEN
jgi:hypothetical protein